MEFYKRFLIGCGLTLLTAIVGYGFWCFNAGMFDNIIFQRGQPVKRVQQVQQFDNPFRLEIKVEGAMDKKINQLPENKESEPFDRVVLEGGVLDIPFTPQAPFGEWDKPVYQDGCEEAAALMAMYWVRGQNLLKTEVNKKIVALANWQMENYGEFRDTSAKDTVERIFKEYFGYENIWLRENIIIQDIIDELNKGRAVIVPTNGRALNNPYYTPPGPERHNLVIRGYDKETDEFIVNDPGTKKGEGYRYKSGVLFEAIRDYLTGYQVLIDGIEKVVIVIDKQ